ncbi:MAG: Fur family transcriptional regulator [Pseudomonadota bacterium]
MKSAEASFMVHGALEEGLRKTCLRPTAKRRLVCSVLETARDHPDVTAIHDRVREQDPSVSISTVYRILRELASFGLIRRLEFADRRSRFEIVRPDQHHHLVDLQSGDVLEFSSEELELRAKRIALAAGYELVGLDLKLYGTPKACPR